MPITNSALLVDIRAFVQHKLLPLEPVFLRHGFGAVLPGLRAAREVVKASGWWAPYLPRDAGGMGLSLMDYAEVSEQLGRTPLGHYAFNCQAPDVGNLELLLAHGSSEQRLSFFDPLARGDIRSCFAMTEPARAGSNPTWLDATARRDGDSYFINGRKWFTSSADGAAFAIVMAVTDPTAAAHQRASMLLVPSDTPGFSIVRNIKVMGETGEDWASHAETLFENCRVPVSARIGDEGAGFSLAQERLGPGRIHHCMRWIGICSRALELMGRRALSRELAPGQALANQQAVQHWIADSYAEIGAARLLVLDAAQAVQTRGQRAARVKISAIKYFTAGVLQRVLDRAIQTHGAMGLTDETPLAYWFAHERGARIYDGADESHKNVVARDVLRSLQ